MTPARRDTFRLMKSNHVTQLYKALVTNSFARYMYHQYQVKHLHQLDPLFHDGTSCLACFQCSNFQAGDKLRSKKKSSRLDETAVFGSACRHEYPQLFLNLKHGESLGTSSGTYTAVPSNPPGTVIITSSEMRTHPTCTITAVSVNTDAQPNQETHLLT